MEDKINPYNNPIKIVYCVKNNNQQRQYYVYIFVGDVIDKIKTIIEKIKLLSLTESIQLLTTNELQQLDNYYKNKWNNEWFTFFFNKEHIDFTFSEQNSNLNIISNKMGKQWIEQHKKQTYKPQFTYGFNIKRNITNKLLKRNSILTIDKLNNNISIKNDDNSSLILDLIQDKNVQEGGKIIENEDEIDYNLDSILTQLENEEMSIQDKIDENNIIANFIDNDINQDNENINRDYNEIDIKENNNIKSEYKNILSKNNIKPQTFITTKDDNIYEENLFDVYNKIYIYDQYINFNNTIKEIKNKIFLSIRNKAIYGNNKYNYLLPSRQYLWTKWTPINNNTQEYIMLGIKWIDNNQLLKIPIKPLSNIKIYENIRSEIEELNNKINKSTTKIKKEESENELLSVYRNYIENNDIFLIDIYNEIGYNPDITEENITNLTNIFCKIYFPYVLSYEIKQILDYINNAFTNNDTKNIKGLKEKNKIKNYYNQETIDLTLSNQINIMSNNILKNYNVSNIIYDNYVIQTEIYLNLISLDMINFKRLELFKIFDNFILNDKYVFIQYTQLNGDIIFKFDELSIDNMISERNMYGNIIKWFSNSKFGLTFKIDYDKTKIPISVTLDIMGKINYKMHWKEEDNVTVDNIENYYYIIKDLIHEINKLITNKFIIPSNDEFKLLFISSIEKFNIDDVNHNDLSDFSRLFFPYFALVIEPKKRISKIQKTEKKSKFGTYLRYKKISNYENNNMIEDRIRYYIKNYDATKSQIIDEISKQFNLTLDKTETYYNLVLTKWPNIKQTTKKLKRIDSGLKYKTQGVDVSIQGKSKEFYKIRLSGVRDENQMDDINDILKVILFLYSEIYLNKNKEFDYIKTVLDSLVNIAERRHIVSDFVIYTTKDSEIKQITAIDDQYAGYEHKKGQSGYARLCQNSGQNNRRRPQQYTDNNIHELLNDGYKLNKANGTYEKQIINNGEKITLRVIKLIGKNQTNIYYTCNPKNNGIHTYIGFLSKSRNPLGNYPPCCFKNDQFNSSNKSKQNLFKTQIGIHKNKEIKEKELTFNEQFYILQDILKIPKNRLGFLPGLLDFYFNKLNNYLITILYLFQSFLKYINK